MHGLKEIICISCYFLSIRADAAQVCALYPDVKKKQKMNCRAGLVFRFN